MGHLCFLWTLRREKGCWTTSAECPKQFGISMPTDATEIEVDFAFWWGGKISDLDLFYQLFNLTFDWGHQAATCFEHNLGMLKEKFAKRLFESLTLCHTTFSIWMVLTWWFTFVSAVSFYFMGLQMSTKQLIFQPSNHWEKPWSLSCPIGLLTWTTRLWS